MAKICPNTSSQAWKDLVSRFGEDITWSMYVRSGDNIPTLRQALNMLKSLNITYAPLSAEEKLLLGVVDKNGKPIVYKDYSRALAKAQDINANYGAYRARVSKSSQSPVGKEYSEVYVEKYMLPEDSKADLSAYTVNPEESYQLSSEPTEKPIKGLSGLLKDWAGKVGFKIEETFDDIKDQDGLPIPAIAKADMVRKIITVATNKADVTTLSEECAHVLVRMLRGNTPFYDRILNAARKSLKYAKVTEEYKDVYGNDEVKIAEETAGKLIAQEVVRLYKEDHPEYTKESSSIIASIKNLFTKILNWFKTKAEVADLTADKMLAQMQPFTNVANMLLNKQVTGLDTKISSYTSGDVYYELTAKMAATQLDIENYLNNVSVTYDAINNRYITSEGKIVARRVSDIVSRGVKRRHQVSSDKESPNNIHTMKGTVIHAYMEAVLNDIISGKTPLQGDVTERIFLKLKGSADFMNRSDEGLRNIIRISHTQFSKVVDSANSLYKDILARQAFINNHTGTNGNVKIFTEKVLYDPKRDLAGTCDVIAVYSNGVIDIYDYKTHEFREKNGEITSEISASMREAWNVQMVQYKNILTDSIISKAESENKKINVSFGATRMLPINVQFNIDTVSGEKSPFGFRELTPWTLDEPSLNPISVAEEVDFDPNISKALEKLYEVRHAQRGAYNRTRSQTDKDSLEKTEDLIQNILVHQDFNFLFKEINDMTDSVQRRLTIPFGQLGSLTADEILKLKQQTDTFLKFIEDIQPAINTEDDLEYNAKLGNALKNLLLVKHLLAAKPVDMILSTTGEDITEPGDHIGWFAGMFSKLSEIAHPIFRAFSKLLKTAQANIKDEMNVALTKIQNAHTSLESWAKEHNTTVQDLFNKIINTETGTLINKYDKSFYEDLETARKPKFRSISFFLNNYMVTRGPKGAGFRYTGKALEDFNRAMDSWKARLEKAKGTSTEEREMRRFEAWRINNDLAYNKDALYSKYNTFIRDRYRVENSDYYSAEFKEIQDILPLVDYYNMYVRFNMEFERITGRQINSRFIANVRNDLVDSIFKNGFAALTDIRSIALSSLELRDESDTIYRSQDETSARDYAGNPIKHIPIFYLDPLTDNLTKKEIADIENSIDPNLSRDSAEWGQIRETKLRELARKKGLKHKSYDLSRVLLMMAQSVYTYKHMKEIEANAQLLLYHAKTNEAKVFTGDNLPNMDKWTGKVRTALGMSSSDVEVLEKFIDLYIYGKTLQGDQKTFTFMGKEYTYGKLARKVVQWSALSTLGFKPILGFRAYAQNYTNYLLNQAEGIYFDRESTKKALEMKRKDPLKYNALMEYFNISNKDVWKIAGDKLSANKANRIFNMENAYYFLDKSDTAFDKRTLASILYAWGFDENSKKIVRISKNPNATPIADLLRVAEDGTITVDERLSKEHIIRIRFIAQDAATKIKGVMPAEDRYLAGTTVAGTLIMQYRNWMPGLLRARWSSLHKNLATDEYDIGRFRVGLSELSAGGLEFTKAFSRLLLRSLPIIGYLANQNVAINEKAAKKQYEEYFREHPTESKLDFTFEDFCRLRVSKLRALAYEMQAIVSFFLAAMIAKVLVPDDPEEDYTGWATKIVTQNMYRAFYGAFLEASFFVDLNSATDIMQSPIACLTWFLNIQRFFTNTIDETRDLITGNDYKGFLWWEEDAKDKSPFFFYSSRLIPGVNAVQDFFDVFDRFTFEQR